MRSQERHRSGGQARQRSHEPGALQIRSPCVWIMDNCFAHRGQKAAKRLRDNWPNAILIHTPVHASWLNQVEIYFSIVQRKVLTPNDFSSLADLEQHLLCFSVPL